MVMVMLALGKDITHLLVMGTRRMDEKRKMVDIKSAHHTISPSKQGSIMSENLKWRNHILDGEQSLVKQLTSRVNAPSVPRQTLVPG